MIRRVPAIAAVHPGNQIHVREVARLVVGSDALQALRHMGGQGPRQIILAVAAGQDGPCAYTMTPSDLGGERDVNLVRPYAPGKLLSPQYVVSTTVVSCARMGSFFLTIGNILILILTSYSPCRRPEQGLRMCDPFLLHHYFCFECSTFRFVFCPV